jgi:seryl-tRNA synthetase
MSISDFLFGAGAGVLLGTIIQRSMTKRNHSINLKLNHIMSTQAELAQQLRDIKDQNDKSRTEVLKKIADLETAIGNAGNTTPEVDAALAALKESVQTDDDIVADQPVTDQPQ